MYLLAANNSCVPCNTENYGPLGAACVNCHVSCQTCSAGASATSCLSCPSGTYLLSLNNSCVACNVDGYFISGAECLKSSRTTIQILKFELQYAPQLYLLSFDTPLDLENSLAEINLYQITNSTNPHITNMSEMSFTLTKLTSSSYQLNLVSYTESSEVRYLLLSFNQFNSNLSYSYMISPPNSTAPIVIDSTVAQVATAVGSTMQAIATATAASALLVYIHSKGASTQLMRILQIMARINFMKLININYLTPLATFYNYTDLGQFGLPNVFTKIPGFNNSQVSTNPAFETSSEGEVIFNDHFRYSFSQVFLDNYGGIVFSTCINLTLYFLVKVASKCFKDKNSKIAKVLIGAGQSFEKSIIITLLVSRYSYLCSALILNYAFIPINGAYQQISLGFAILYTVIIVSILILAICASFYHGKNKVKLKFIRPQLGLIALLCQEHHSKSYLGRIMTFWTLLSNLLIMLALELIRKWVIAQLSILMVLNVLTILIALPKNVFKATANKIVVVGTELGFIIVSILFIVMYALENSNLYQVRLIMSWTVVAVNVAIILFQIGVKIVEFFRLRRKKKREELTSKMGSVKDRRIQTRRRSNFRISIGADLYSFENNFRSVDDTVSPLK